MKRILCIAAAAVSASPGLAIVNGTTTNAFPFVGQVNYGCGVVIAPNWVITARHVGSGTFKLNGVDYTPDRVVNFDGSNQSPVTDLLMMHFANNFPNFAPPYFGSDIVGKQFAMVGWGEDGNLRADGSGYDLDSHSYGPLRVGYNKVSLVDQEVVDSIVVWSILYDLDGDGKDFFGDGGPILGPNGVPVEATLGNGDSGGGFFIQINGVWRLIGVNDFVFDGNGNGNDYDFGDGGGAVALGPYQAYIAGLLYPFPVSSIHRG